MNNEFVELHFTLTKVEDNRIKEIFVKILDIDEIEKEESKSEANEDDSKNK